MTGTAPAAETAIDTGVAGAESARTSRQFDTLTTTPAATHWP